jgi:hypothetical protein
MIGLKEALLDEVRYRAEAEARRLSREFVRAASEDKEAILAALEFEKWLAEGCAACQRRWPGPS